MTQCCPTERRRYAGALLHGPSVTLPRYIVYNVDMSTTSPLGRPISVRLPQELRERIEALAAATRRSQGDVVREVLERDLERLEWEHRLIATAADLRSARVQAVPLDDLERELGLEDLPVDDRILADIE